MKQKMITLSITLSLLVLSFLAGTLPGKVFASNSPISGIWRTVDGPVAYVQVYDDGSGLCMFTKDGHTFTPFLDTAIEKGVFEAGDIPAKGQDLHMRILFEGLSAEMTLTDLLTGTVSTFHMTLSLNDMAEPDVQKDGLWLTEGTDTPYYIVQHYANGSARLFAGDDTATWDMFVESSKGAPNFFSGKDPENGQWVFFSFLGEGVGRVQRLWGRPLYSSGVKQAWTVGELTLWGAAAVDDPLMGGNIHIYGRDGERILHQENGTGPYGDFYFELGAAQLHQLVEGFRIEVTGGTFMGESFDGRLMADVQQFAPGDWVQVNDVTTILAAYLERHPEMGYGDVEAVLSRYLELPDYITLDWVIEVMDYYPVFFSDEKFVEEMEKQLGSIRFDEYIAWILDEMDQGKTHSFADPDFNNPFADASPSGESIITAKSPLKTGLGVIFSLAGGIFDVADEVFSAIEKNEQNQAVTHIINTLNAVQAQLADVQAKVNAIHDAQIKMFFTQQLDKLHDWTTDIGEHLKRLKYLARNTSMSNETKRQDILKIATKVKAEYSNHLTRINEKMASGKTIGQSFTENLIVRVKNMGPGVDTSRIDEAFPKFFLKYILIQFQGYYLLSNAHKYFDKGDTYGEGKFKAFRDNSTMLKAQVSDMVKDAEKYVLNHQSEAFYYKEFPCKDPGLSSTSQTDAKGTLLQYVDYLDEILNPTYGFVDAENGDYTPKEGALTVRIIFPVYQEEMKVKKEVLNNIEYLQLVGVTQKKDTTWLDTAPNLRFCREDIPSNCINLNNPDQFKYTSSTIPGKDPYGAKVHWKTAVGKMSTVNLISRPYLADKGNETGKALKKSNPLIYTGGDSMMRILTYSSTGNLKYGFYSLYQVPTMENALKTFHWESKPSTYIWVDKDGYDGSVDLRVFSGIKNKKHHNGRTYELLLKYTGNNCYTISTTHNPYHFFEPKMEEFWDHSSRHAIYARRKPTNADYRWNRWVLFQDAVHKDDTEAIYFKWLQEYPAYGNNGMFASRDWPDAPEPLYYSNNIQQWGATHPNDLRKLFPKKHGTEWQFE